MNNVAEKKLLDMHERGYAQTAVVITGPGGTAIVSEMGRVTWLDKALARKITGPAPKPDAIDKQGTTAAYRLSNQELRTAIEATNSMRRVTGKGSHEYQIIAKHLESLLLIEKARAQ